MIMMSAQDFGYFILGYATGGLTLILIKLVIQLHEADLLFKSKETEGR